MISYGCLDSVSRSPRDLVPNEHRQVDVQQDAQHRDEHEAAKHDHKLAVVQEASAHIRTSSEG